MLPDIDRRIQAFSRMGEEFLRVSQAMAGQSPGGLSPRGQELFETAMESPMHNPWFTTRNVGQALESLGQMLQASKLGEWISRYPRLQQAPARPLTVAVIMAGNIPLVGFHDFMSVLISGHNIMVKLSTQDKHLPKAAARLLEEIEPAFSSSVTFCEGILSGFDAVIATGSNNSSRYFDYYFGKYPHIIRGNRSSAAVLTGNETPDQLQELGKDVFSYFGLGCRNVSALFVPESFNPDILCQAWQSHAWVMDNHKFANNYDYQKAVLLINKIPFTDTGFCLLRSHYSLSPPVAVIHLIQWEDTHQLEEMLQLQTRQLQCVVAPEQFQIKTAGLVPFGKSQQPELWDYADGIDTLDFLSRIGQSIF